MPTPRNSGGVVHDFEGEVVAVMGRLIDGLGRDLRQVSVDERGQPAHGAGLDLLDRAQRDVGTRGVRLEAAVVAALAATALDIDRRVPDLAGDVRRAVVQLAVEDEPAADARADGDADGVAARRARRPTHHSPSTAQLASLSSAARHVRAGRG